MSLSAFDASLLGPALAAGLLVLATHVPLGRQVLERGIIFIDLALAQIAGLGVLAAHLLGGNGFWPVQLAAAVAALAGAWLLYITEKHLAVVQEAIIGAAFVLAASLAVLLLAADPRGGEHFRELLAGQILWVSWRELVPVALLYTGILLVWFGRPHRPAWLFYVLLALAVTASVQLVGVFLVFASLILPALAVHAWRASDARGLAAAYAIGASGYAAGLAGSALADLPAGALIVWAMAAIGVVVMAGSKAKKWRTEQASSEKIQ